MIRRNLQKGKIYKSIFCVIENKENSSSQRQSESKVFYAVILLCVSTCYGIFALSKVRVFEIPLTACKAGKRNYGKKVK